jgi:hypothetical protein
VLGLVYLKQEANLLGESFIELAVTATVPLSVFVHSISAAPAINVYDKQVESKDADAPEY